MALDPKLLASVHKAFIGFSLRAEKTNERVLVNTFVDSAPLIDVMSAANNQIIYGRRGTGKTHALKVVADSVERKGETAVFIDLRAVGSNTSIYNDTTKTIAARAAQLISDVLQSVLGSLYEIAVNALDTHPHPEQVTIRLDDLQKAISEVRITGVVENEATDVAGGSGKLSAGLTASTKDGLGGSLGAEAGGNASRTIRSKESGTETLHLDFANIQSALEGLVQVAGVSRLWLMIDEWSEVPLELQPYLADLFRRTCLPARNLIVKIAAIEHRSNFSLRIKRGEYIGFELGADVTANLNLDDFLVFEADEARSIQFFKNLIFNHYRSSAEADTRITTPDDLVQIAFTQQNVFAEFVRAVEGVPRDALNLAATVATKAFGKKIAVADVGEAARDWYQRDKMSAIRSDEELSDVLTTIINEVIGSRRARAFLFSSKTRNQHIEDLFDARLLHILKKNIASKDEPGARYDVFKIDYGCYVDLKNTGRETLGLFQDENDQYVGVPKDDYRSIRRAILRPEFLERDKSEAEISDEILAGGTA